jgi:protoporphyrinogen oxidase
MAQDIVSNGHKIFLNEKITTLDYSNKKYQLKTSQGREQEYDYIISSMPLTTLVRCLGNPPMDIVKACDALRFRSTILVYLKINLSDLFQDQWIYIHSEKVKVGRITNFKNWCIPVNKEQQSTIISMEYWCQEDDQFWNMSETDLIQLAKKEIVELNIAEESDIDLGHIHKIKKCYPIYEVNYQEQLNPIQEYLKKFDRLYPIGRYGSFKYNNQDHSILMGILSAKKILGQHKQSLWDINSDYDYQEDAKVEVS